MGSATETNSSVSADPRASFEAHLAREILESERTRTAILAGIFALLMVAFPLAVLVFYEDYARNFRSLATIGYVVSVTGALVAYELLVRRLLARWLRRGGMPPPFARRNALIETSVPTILILVVARDVDPVIVLQGPAGFLSQCSSSCRRCGRFCALGSRVVAASEYVALSSRAQGRAGAAMPATFAAPGFILFKGLVPLRDRRGLRRAPVEAPRRQRLSHAAGAAAGAERLRPAGVARIAELLKQGPDIRASACSSACCSWTSATSRGWCRTSPRRKSSSFRTRSSARRWRS
jgi:hypothetical protein